jgi:hypothetical protein
MVSGFIIALTVFSLAFIPITRLCIESVEVPPDMSLHQLTQLTQRLTLVVIALGAYTGAAIMLITAYLYLNDLESKRAGNHREPGASKRDD